MFYDDLQIIDVPVLVMHGEDDQMAPFPATGARSIKLLKHGTLKSYPGFPHGMPATHADTINADLLEFIKAKSYLEFVIPNAKRRYLLFDS